MFLGQAARKFRRLTKRGVSAGDAFERVAADLRAVDHWNERERRGGGMVVMCPLDYPIESSIGLLFPDESGLILGDGRVWVSRQASASKDLAVYQYMDCLIPIVPIGRVGRVPYATRYPFTEGEQQVLNQAVQIVDIVLMNEHGLMLSPWMRWFHKDRLLVKNLISAGGDAIALAWVLLGLLSAGRLTSVEEMSADDDGASLVMRHQSVP